MSYSNPLAAYLTGEATEEQAQVIEAWANADPENRRLLERLEQAWNSQQLSIADLPDLDNWEQEVYE